MDTLGLSIPLFDEAAGCEREIRALWHLLRQRNVPFRLVLVDNGSTDGTGDIVDALARRLEGVRALHLATNAGYGGGILAGLEVLDTEVVGWHWGDGQVRPAVVAEAWRLLLDRSLHLVKVHRIRRHDGASRAAVSRLYAAATRWGLGLSEPDVNGCPKLLTRPAFERLALRSRNWLLDLEAVYKAERAGLRMGRIQTPMYRRREGRSKVSPRTALRFAASIAAIRRGHPPWEHP